ncbi:thiamine pyrophosphate-dependent dehydrogenase E1 component subunit alpha [Ramlibacter sp. AN1015]|uniref:thiamine pyrophosphate-dependent dehydrogenase E1 component subunit alpha n=1 Tax=Ramlibacter sp. AN1015 TaxID=3133428 RepID=UPI0030C18CF1
MLRIRAVEQVLARMFADGEVPGFIHLSIGQEAVAAGVCAALRPQDTLATTHRGHGHVIAKGLELPGFFAEILGRDAGVCRGRGGSMHVSDMRRGIIGANGIVGAGIPIALGTALATQLRGGDDVAVAIFGDGAMAEGVLHESLNWAALRRLPMLFVCENNGWSEFSPTERQVSARLADLAAAFRLRYAEVDGDDVQAVFDAACAGVAAARSTGPQVLECRTHRGRGHYEGDNQAYRQDAALPPQHDPIARARQTLLREGVDPAQLDALGRAAHEEIEAALAQARASDPADFDAAREAVYTMETAR